MEQYISITVSVVALTVAFVAVAICRRPSEAPKEKKTRKRRQPKDEAVTA